MLPTNKLKDYKEENYQEMIKGIPKLFNFYIKLFLPLFPFLLITEELQASPPAEDEIHVLTKDKIIPVNSFELKQAERLFYGLLPITREAPACADCHYTSYIDTLNWNPSAFDIAITFAGKSIEDLMKVINKPVGKKMAEVHSGYDISEEQAILLQAYLEKLNKQEVPARKPVINNLFLFILINLIGLGATIDLLFTRKIQYKALHFVLILGTAIYVSKTIIVEGIAIGRQENYAPIQPIKFSHKMHTGDNKIDCQYCHNLAEQSKSAGIPSANVCMNCHVLIVEGTLTGKFEINKISEALLNLTPIEWVKVHNLPDHVFFSHAQHAGAGKLDCAECHEGVETMNVIQQVNDLSMGWCLDCHRTRKVDFENNEYFTLFEEYYNKIKQGIIDSVLVENIGGTNCMKCHY
ncbi:hypothetical protein ES705_09124 [subsurface metagenome]